MYVALNIKQKESALLFYSEKSTLMFYSENLKFKNLDVAFLILLSV